MNFREVQTHVFEAVGFAGPAPVELAEELPADFEL
jgi:hypothetical protein